MIGNQLGREREKYGDLPGKIKVIRSGTTGEFEFFDHTIFGYLSRRIVAHV